MYSFQDYETALAAGEGELLKFIVNSVNNYRNSAKFKHMLVAREYYNRRNIEIHKRKDTVLSTGELSKSHKRVVRPVNRKCNGFFAKSVNQLCMYLLGNGVTINGNVKEKLGTDFDVTLQRIGRQALIDGVCYGYWNGAAVIPLYSTEFFGLYDERTSEMKVGFRFYQVDEKKPMFIEIFDADGVTVYKKLGKIVQILTKKKPYLRAVLSRGDSLTELSKIEYNNLPIITFGANDEHESFLSMGLKYDIDLYDRIMADFGDNLDRANDIYYVVQNYGGANLKQLIDEIEEYRTIYTDGDSGAEIKTIEVPYAARSEALRLLERQMYKETQTLDTEELSGGGLTNVAIKAAMTELDLKADMFEWQAESFVRGLLEFAVPKNKAEISFKRRSLVNDAEIIDNIYKMRQDIDQKTALELNPLISEIKLDEIMKRMENLA